MIAKYMIIPEDGDFTVLSSIFICYVGSTAIEQDMLRSLREWCADKGYFFSIVNSSSQEFIVKSAESFGIQIDCLDIQMMDIKDFFMRFQPSFKVCQTKSRMHIT